MDKASELKIAVDKVARHVAEVAPELTAEESKMLQDILELPLMFPILGKLTYRVATFRLEIQIKFKICVQIQVVATKL